MPLRHLFVAAGLLAAALFTGCSTVHQVTIDAISDRSKPLGASYHLEVNDPTGGVDPTLHQLAVSAINDALAARGLYETPASVRPDMVIEASYAIGHGYVNIVTEQNTSIMLGPSITQPPQSKAIVVYDKTLELIARAPGKPGSTDKQARTGDELWSLKAKIVDPKQELAPYLPALASACIDYIGENPGREITFPVDSVHAEALLRQRPSATATPAAK